MLTLALHDELSVLSTHAFNITSFPVDRARHDTSGAVHFDRTSRGIRVVRFHIIALPA